MKTIYPTQKVTVKPAGKMKCFNCKRETDEGKCPCGATNEWSHDPFDGWQQTGHVHASAEA
jgi:hypothetical protein